MWGIHALKVLLEVLLGKIRGKGDELLDARVLGVFGANVVVASIQHILVHERSSRSDLSEERNLDGLAVLDLLTLLDEKLAGELASVLAVERGDTVSFGMITLLEWLESAHKVMATGNTVRYNTLTNTGSNGSLDNGGHGVDGTNNLGLELGRNMKLNLLEEVFRSTETTDDENVLQGSVLGLDGDNLVADEFQNTVHDGLETLQDFLVGEGHETFLDTSLGEFSLDTDINSPLLTVGAEISLDSVLKVHDTLGVDTAGSLGTVGKLHFADLGSENVAKVAVKSGRTTRITGSSCAFGDREWALLLDFISNQIDSTTTAIHNKDSVVDLEVQNTSLGAEESGSFGFGNQSQAVIILISEKSSLDSGSTGSSLASIVPNGGDGEVVSDVALFSVEHVTEGLLESESHGLAELEEVVGGDIDFGLARRQRWQVNGVDICVSAAEHELQLEPFHLLHAWLGVASWGKRIGNIGAPSDNFLVLIVVEDGRDLSNWWSVSISAK